METILFALPAWVLFSAGRDRNKYVFQQHVKHLEDLSWGTANDWRQFWGSDVWAGGYMWSQSSTILLKELHLVFPVKNTVPAGTCWVALLLGISIMEDAFRVVHLAQKICAAVFYFHFTLVLLGHSDFLCSACEQEARRHIFTPGRKWRWCSVSRFSISQVLRMPRGWDIGITSL